MLTKTINLCRSEGIQAGTGRPLGGCKSSCSSPDKVCSDPCFIKQANSDLKDFIETLKPDPKYLYLHIIALGSGEYYGPNTNGDYFPEDGLVKYHHTFKEIAKHFKHHDNKDTSPSYGHVPFSTYNPIMRRVELVIAVDKEKAPDLVEKVERGERLAYSMSCRIPWDQCSICGNRSSKKPEYCDHIKNHLMEVMPDGRQVYMVNPEPVFFDISYVLRPADKTAMLLRKVAVEQEDEPSAKEIDGQANEASTSPKNDLPMPTKEQIEAGNYKKGHVRISGIDISIENPKGSVRSGVDNKGKKWSTTLKHHYGYILDTKGKDKDHLDVFLGKDIPSDMVYVVNQIVPDTGKLDEHKVMMGFNSLNEARNGYLANYDKTGPSRIGSIKQMAIGKFKEWIKNGNTTKEASKCEKNCNDCKCKGKEKPPEKSGGLILSEEGRDIFVKYAMPILEDREPDLPIDRISGFKLQDILSTLGFSGILLKPSEFTRIIMVKRRQVCPDLDYGKFISIQHFNPRIFEIVRGIFPVRTFFNPYITDRLEKLAFDFTEGREPSFSSRHAKDVAIGGAGFLGGSYLLYKTETGKSITRGLIDMARKNPGALLLLAGIGVLAHAALSPPLKIRAVSETVITPSSADDIGIFAARNRTGNDRGIRLNNGNIYKQAEDVIKNTIHPFGELFVKNYNNT